MARLFFDKMEMLLEELAKAKDSKGRTKISKERLQQLGYHTKLAQATQEKLKALQADPEKAKTPEAQQEIQKLMAENDMHEKNAKAQLTGLRAKVDSDAPPRPKTKLEQLEAESDKEHAERQRLASEKGLQGAKAAQAKFEQETKDFNADAKKEKVLPGFEGQRGEEGEKGVGYIAPSQQLTLKEIKQAAARSEPKKEKPFEPEKWIDPEKQEAQEQGKHKAIFDKLYDRAHELHNGGDTDAAYKELKRIPETSWPPELAHYKPEYIHYGGMTPNHWKAMPPEQQDAVHQHHRIVMSGFYNNHDNPAVKNAAMKVQSLVAPQKPKTVA
jgi:hypothetical protein